MPASRLHPFLRLFLCAILVIVVTLVASGVAAGVLFAFGSRLGLANLNATQLTQKITHDYGLLLTIFAYPPALLIVWLFRTQVDKRSWSSLGFHRAGSLSNFALGALTGLLTLSVLFALMWLSGAVQFSGLSQDVITHGWTYAIGALLCYAVAFLLVGFMEETAFRGYALHNASEWFGWKGAVAFQAIIFALIHLTNVTGSSDPTALKSAIGALPSLALIAMFFAISYRKTGSLWFPIGFHTAWNFCLGCVFSQPVSAIGTFRLFDVQETGKNFLSGGDFGAEGSFFLIPIIVALIYLLWRAPDHPQAVADLDTSEPMYMPSYPAPIPQPQPAYAVAVPFPITSPSPSEETEEEQRENRFKARFGSGEGFDSGMLRELKQMQEVRDEAERQKQEQEQTERRADEARQEAVSRAQQAAESSVAPTSETPSEEARTAVDTPIDSPTEEIAISTSPSQPVITAPVAPPAPVTTPTAPPVSVTPVASPTPSSTPPTSSTANEEVTQETPVTPKKARPRW